MFNHWIYFAGIFVFASALHTLCLKMAGDGISPAMSMIVSNSIVFILSIVIFAVFKFQGQEMVANTKAIGWVSAGAICVVIFELSFFYIFFYNAPMAVAATVMRAGALSLTILAGIFLLKEEITLERAIGFCMALGSIYLLTKK